MRLQSNCSTFFEILKYELEGYFSYHATIRVLQLLLSDSSTLVLFLYLLAYSGCVRIVVLGVNNLPLHEKQNEKDGFYSFWR